MSDGVNSTGGAGPPDGEEEVLAGDALMSAITGLEWALDAGQLIKIVRCKDFAEALAYVNAVGEIAEAADHHPDIEIRWNTVTLRLFTHSRRALTAADVVLAHSIDTLD